MHLVVDSGFPRGRQKWEELINYWQFFSDNYMIMKEVGPKGEHASLAPPVRSATE